MQCLTDAVLYFCILANRTTVLMPGFGAADNPARIVEANQQSHIPVFEQAIRRATGGPVFCRLRFVWMIRLGAWQGVFFATTYHTQTVSCASVLTCPVSNTCSFEEAGRHTR